MLVIMILQLMARHYHSSQAPHQSTRL